MRRRLERARIPGTPLVLTGSQRIRWAKGLLLIADDIEGASWDEESEEAADELTRAILRIEDAVAALAGVKP